VRIILYTGKGGVGKTSITQRFIANSFDDDATSSYGVTFFRQPVEVPGSDAKVTLTIWDTAGQERYRSLAAQHYKDASAAIMAFDITQRKSFEGLQTWIKEVKEKAPEGILIIIAGNKCDMIEKEKVSSEEANKLAKEEKAIFHFISAKDNIGILDMFNEIASRLALGPKSGAEVIPARVRI